MKSPRLLIFNFGVNMMDTDEEWEAKRVLILVKTYPSPSTKYQEVVCTAGVTDKGEFIRLYPIKYRYLSDEQQFKKFNWIEVRVKKNPQDQRPESFKVNYDSIKVLGEIGPRNSIERFNKICSLISPSMEDVYHKNELEYKTLGIFKPKSVEELKVEESSPDWTDDERNILSQLSFGDTEVAPLQKIPYDFSFTYHCDDPNCKGHKMRITDWEICQTYRNFKRIYGEAHGLEILKEKYLGMFSNPKTNTYFIVGTVHKFNTFIIIGVINIDKSAADFPQMSLF